MREEKKKNSNLPTKFSLTVRIMVALYLFYILYSLRGVFERYSGIELIFFLVMMVLFAVAAVFFCVHSGIALVKGRYVGGAMDENNDNNKDDNNDISEDENNDNNE